MALCFRGWWRGDASPALVSGAGWLHGLPLRHQPFTPCLRNKASGDPSSPGSRGSCAEAPACPLWRSFSLQAPRPWLCVPLRVPPREGKVIYNAEGEGCESAPRNRERPAESAAVRTVLSPRIRILLVTVLPPACLWNGVLAVSPSFPNLSRL